jgi:hypothetical protein
LTVLICVHSLHESVNFGIRQTEASNHFNRLSELTCRNIAAFIDVELTENGID